MKKILNLFFISILFFSIGCKRNQVENYNPKALHGIIDISNWDFDRNPIIKLNGDWEFYWNMLLEPADFTDQPPPVMTGYFPSPSSWHNYRLPEGTRIKNEFGYATFRLIIKNNKSADNLALKISFMNTAYKLFVQGKFFASNGQVGKNVSESIPQFVPIVKSLRSTSNTIELLLQVSNFHYRFGGMNEIFLGKEDDIARDIFWNNFFKSLLIGVILIMGFYHICLFLLRKKERASLYFGLFCIIIGLRTLSTEQYISIFFQNFNIWDLVIRIDYLTFYIGPSLFLLFLRYFYPKELNIKIMYVILSISFIFLLADLTLPTQIFTTYLDIPYEFIVLIESFYCCYVLWLAIYNKRFGALYLIIGFVFFVSSVVNDVINALFTVKTVNFVFFGLVVLIFFKSFVLAISFSMTNNRLENLVNNLEKNVKQRTRQLEISKEKIKRLNFKRTYFFINFTHEIKTPLTLIKNYLESDIKKRGINEETKIIKQNLDKLVHDVVNFLDIEKLIKGQVFYDHNHVINFSETLQAKLILFKEMAKRKFININTFIEEGLYIKIDIYALDRIINNLLDNAIRYNKINGCIDVYLNKLNDKIDFVVNDTGFGILEEKKKNIFKPFYQISHDKRSLQGIGIGLSIVKQILKQIKAEIKIESELNKGTKFIITFNRYNNLTKEECTHNNLISKPIDNFIEMDLMEEKYTEGRNNILIIDDNINMLAYLQTNLMEYYNVFYARDGKEALEKLNKIPLPNFILSDIMMDRINGYELFELITKDKRFKKIPFIFLTAKTANIDKLNALKKGAVDFISKPFSIDEVIAKIDSIIKIQQTQRLANIEELEEKISKFIRIDKKENNCPSHFQDKFNQYKITPKEKKIIELLIQGFEYKEIGGKLNISLNTIKPYIKVIYKKFAVHNKVQLINFLKS